MTNFSKERLRVANEDAEDLLRKLIRVCYRASKTFNVEGTELSVPLVASASLISYLIYDIGEEDLARCLNLYSRVGELIASKIFELNRSQGEENGTDKSDPKTVRG